MIDERERDYELIIGKIPACVLMRADLVSVYTYVYTIMSAGRHGIIRDLLLNNLNN